MHPTGCQRGSRQPARHPGSSGTLVATERHAHVAAGRPRQVHAATRSDARMPGEAEDCEALGRAERDLRSPIHSDRPGDSRAGPKLAEGSHRSSIAGQALSADNAAYSLEAQCGRLQPQREGGPRRWSARAGRRSPRSGSRPGAGADVPDTCGGSSGRSASQPLRAVPRPRGAPRRRVEAVRIPSRPCWTATPCVAVATYCSGSCAAVPAAAGDHGRRTPATAGRRDPPGEGPGPRAARPT